MIFVAVGTQFAFDRLIKAVDTWLIANHQQGVAQIAEGNYLPQAMQWQRFMDMPTFNQHFNNADLIISHAGMGNIITALEGQKPIIVMNRQHALGEHRNDHQADGLAWMAKLPGVYTARTEAELQALLDQQQSLTTAPINTQNRRQALVDFLDQTLQTRLAL